MTAPFRPEARPLEHIERVRWLRALAQIADASTESTLYDCPPGRLARGRVFVCNRSPSARTFSIRLQENGAADDNKQYLAYAFPLPANDTNVTEELTLTAGDSIEVLGSANDVTFQFIGHTEPKDTP
jgi:hypothetical protein